jgi:hypothetical protein
MAESNKEETQAKSLGLALLAASRIYESFVIPTYEGFLRRRPYPPHRRAIIGLVGRQRRFLRAVYTLADTGQFLEAVGPLRSMFEFLVCQRWLAQNPERNWQIWMAEDHAARDLWRERLRQHAPALHAAAAAALTEDQRREGEAVAAARTHLAVELGDWRPGDRRSLEQRAADVGLSFLYDGLYRYESSAATHPTMLGVDLFLKKHAKGLLLCAEPTAQFTPLPVYLDGAVLLYESLKGSGELTRALRLPRITSIGRELYALAENRVSARLPNWIELLPAEAFET